MKVAHFAQFGPNQSGLYATVKDLILAERMQGINAEMIDSALPCSKCGFYEIRVGCTDGEITTQPLEWAYDADLLVRHTCIPQSVEGLGIPMVMCIHGRPENSFLLEHRGKMPIYSFMEQLPYDKRYKLIITFWEEFIPHWKTIMPTSRVEYVPAPVNMKEFTPNGEAFDLGQKRGEPNLLVVDNWRDDETPFNVIWAALKFYQDYCPTARLHVFGLPEAGDGPVAVMARALDRSGVWGKAYTLHNQMPQIYRSADILLTPHVIATRVIREGLASGLPIVAGTGCRYTPFTANPKDIDGYAKAINRVWEMIKSGTIFSKIDSRQVANDQFEMKKAGAKMADLFQQVVGEFSHKRHNLRPQVKRGPRRLFLDVGAHVGESIDQLYRQVSHANLYDIVCFEPLPEALKELNMRFGHMSNVTIIDKAVGPENDVMNLYPGYYHMGEGSTFLPGKKTGQIEYTQPVKVEVIDFVEWFKNHVFAGDKVILKINIEGGEYMLLPKILDSDILQHVSHLFVQFHADKFENNSEFRAVELRLAQEQCRYPDLKLSINRGGFFNFQELHDESCADL